MFDSATATPGRSRLGSKGITYYRGNLMWFIDKRKEKNNLFPILSIYSSLNSLSKLSHLSVMRVNKYSSVDGVISWVIFFNFYHRFSPIFRYGVFACHIIDFYVFPEEIQIIYTQLNDFKHSYLTLIILLNNNNNPLEAHKIRSHFFLSNTNNFSKISDSEISNLSNRYFCSAFPWNLK